MDKFYQIITRVRISSHQKLIVVVVVVKDVNRGVPSIAAPQVLSRMNVMLKVVNRR
jgi:hypothetical protein